ncbi:ferrous iron transport protein B [Ruminococcus gauvreauii]|uniref:ferrous iron transport protein B n=1 Tax=Ruminococcus gauvreauii TaxID=438033 RepID=UPI0039845065
MGNKIRVGFMGNPNCGKTTLFNAYTGANLKVANWPGVTVEKVEGSMKFQEFDIQLVDLPGTYSLTSYTMEEVVARQYVLSDEVDVIVDVADASSLERNLYLTLQLIELGKPVVLALNMMDIVEKRGMEIDLHRLPEMLGIPVIPVCARKKKGLDILMHAVVHHKDFEEKQPLIHHHDITTEHRHQHHNEFVMVYSDEIEDKIDAVRIRLKETYPGIPKARYYAIKLLEYDEETQKTYPLDLTGITDKCCESQIINEKYDFIEEVIREVLVNKEQKEESTDRIDRLLTHRIWGFPMFLCIMAFVFLLTFTLGDWLKGYMGILLDFIAEEVTVGMHAVGAAGWLISLVVDGIISGVGGILTFLPNIFILFLALAFLEDSGYMARAAYVMDSLMGRMGLSGRAFIPMILGFGCTVPAVMASRTLENRADRMKTILITPFMSCSARLPVYVLFSQMFFGDYAMFAAFSMYVLGLFVAILVAFVLHILDRKEAKNNLLIELPEYKAPSAQTVWIYVWEKVKDYLTKAGTTIFIASIVMWFVLNFGPQGFVSDITQSFGSLIGKAVVPVFAPIGLGYWQIIVALIAGISAKEVVVSSCSVLFGVGNATSAAGMATLAGILGTAGFGMLNAYCMMTFSLLYIPCIATLATIKKESGSWKMMFLTAGFQLCVAWVVTFLIYQVGSMF